MEMAVLEPHHFVVADGGEAAEHEVDIHDGRALCACNI